VIAAGALVCVVLGVGLFVLLGTHRVPPPLEKPQAEVAIVTPSAEVASPVEKPPAEVAIVKPPAKVASAVEAIAPRVKVSPMDGLKYVWIPPGQFTRGCSPGDNECNDDEKPSHKVTIAKGFWMGQTPVTVGAYKRYAQATGKTMPPEKDSSGRRLNAAGSDSLPVVLVTWDEAAGYCGQAGTRLPTEAEWEYAARAGSTGARYGSLDKIAWSANNSGRQRIVSLYVMDKERILFDNGNGPKPVGQKQPNAFGLYDMLGNVWSLTADLYKEGGTLRTVRGGSWYDFRLRVSCREGVEPGNRYFSVGLRCVGE
jgi:formylglycine-generating enzyme required for sulfatase activity